MRVQPFVALILMLPFCLCTYPHDAFRSTEDANHDPADKDSRSVRAEVDRLRIDIAQHTCASYVVRRSIALVGPAAFDVDDDGSLPQWNAAPEAPMLACRPAPVSSRERSGQVPQQWP